MKLRARPVVIFATLVECPGTAAKYIRRRTVFKSAGIPACVRGHQILLFLIPRFQSINEGTGNDWEGFANGQ
jgi:hypothetical protein